MRKLVSPVILTSLIDNEDRLNLPNESKVEFVEWDLNTRRRDLSHSRQTVFSSAWRKVILMVTCLCSFSINELAIAGSYTLLSPQGFQRQSGAPVTESITFSALDPSGAYTLNIYNGGLEDHELTGELVSSSTISLNGAQIFGPNDFNQNVNTLSKAITLQSGNELTVKLKGKPGGVITLAIIGEDAVAPIITASVNPTANGAGWHKDNATVSFQCDDATSGIVICSEPVELATEGVAQQITGTAEDYAGNQATTSVSISLDKTMPTIVAQAVPEANVAGWHQGPVQVNFACEDDLSGVSNCEPPITAVAEGKGQFYIGSSSDLAGNTASAPITLNIDLTAPSIQITSPLAGAVLSERLPVISLALTDNLELNLNTLGLSGNGATFDCSVVNGIATCVPGSDLPQGDIVLVANVADQAGNEDTDQISFRIESDLDGDGIDDNSDQCPNTPSEEIVDSMGCSPSQLDDDNDGVNNAIDQCPSTPSGKTVNASGCAASELDSDNDGVTDDLDQCPNTQTGVAVDSTGCPIVGDEDTDDDSIPDSIDNCPTVINPDQADSDNDGTGDACEIVGSITITSPTVNQLINNSTVSVTGTFTGPAGSGVTVNARQACAYNGQFVINNIPINPGNDAITAQLAPAAGLGESMQITINRDGDSLYTVEPNSNCAVAPFDASFRLVDINERIQQIGIDYDNDGANDASMTDFTNPVFTHAYTSPGTYQINITGIEFNGDSHSQSLRIIVQDGIAIDAVIQTSWQNITSGLSNNNLTQALNELTPNGQEKYAPIFEALQGDLPTILSTFSNLQVVDINTEYAEYAINRTIGVENRIFLIYFVKDENGAWKLDSM